jgi:hypothetical protein
LSHSHSHTHCREAGRAASPAAKTNRLPRASSIPSSSCSLPNRNRNSGAAQVFAFRLPINHARRCLPAATPRFDLLPFLYFDATHVCICVVSQEKSGTGQDHGCGGGSVGEHGGGRRGRGGRRQRGSRPPGSPQGPPPAPQGMVHSTPRSSLLTRSLITSRICTYMRRRGRTTA